MPRSSSFPVSAAPSSRATMTPPVLNPLTFPFGGSHLIEASAGTGKTFTIAMLYVRLVLGHGVPTSLAPSGALTPPEILVVTFTEAATKELRDRIRARLTEAATYFRAAPQEASPPEGRDLLHELRAGYDPSLWSTCAQRLELAAEWMDEAAISTIHSWCNRMLREHAFDSLSLFNQQLETDLSDMFAEVVRDYWRIFFYPLSRDELGWVLKFWKTPDELLTALRPLQELISHLPEVDDAPAGRIRNCLTQRASMLEQLKAPWRTGADEVLTLLDKARVAKDIDGRRLRQDWYINWLGALRDWATSSTERPALSDSAWERLTPDGLAEAWKTGSPPDHPALSAFPALKEALDNLPDPEQDVLVHAARWVANTFATTRRRRAQVGFNDLLTELDAALGQEGGEKASGTRLAETLRQQFPVALIDEFQDTDPIQYRIFDRVYRMGHRGEPDDQAGASTALILIGDPKQAIYAFRGADIYTYLRARRAVGERLYTLGTNFRSTQAMVEATNDCFGIVEDAPSSLGAFLFRDPHHGANPVPFFKVAAQGRTDQFWADGQPVAAMTLAVLSDPDAAKCSKTTYIERMSEWCASQVVAWLNHSREGRAGFAGVAEAEKRPLDPLRPEDMAILVNNGTEAASIRQALARRDVRSVYLSDKGTVYATPQAEEVLRWLAACADPDNDRLLRAALSMPSLGLSFSQLDELNHRDDVWEVRVLQFKGYRELWQTQGVLPMIRRLLLDFGVSQRLLQRGEQQNGGGFSGQSGERVLTDLLHLAELLQQASMTLEGEHALVRFLSEQMAAPEGEADGRKLRLESDANLVKVVTIHKSKGLEYPLVFLPFMAATRPVKKDDTPIKWHDEEGALHVELQSEESVVVAAERDRLGEDLRKLYVALTRARYVTWIGWAAIKDAPPTALGHIAGLNDAPDPLTRLHEWAQGVSGLEVIENEGDICDECVPYLGEDFPIPQAQDDSLIACRPERRVAENWWISSYSRLPVAGMKGGATRDDSTQAEKLREGYLEEGGGGDAVKDGSTAINRERGEAASAGMPAPLLSRSLLHDFPRGPAAGTLLHDVLEWAARAGFGHLRTREGQAELRQKVAQRCQMQHWEAWVDPLANWMQGMVSAPLGLGEATLSLADLTTARPEMEFWVEARHVHLERLDAVVRQYTLGQCERPALGKEQLNGMLKGFIDLVFEYQGRYYIADYKSNWLGPSVEHYTPQAMTAAMGQHRYDLQYVIYLFALHRLLASRVRGYDYDTHIGGAAYLFLRALGTQGAEGHGTPAFSYGVHFDRPPRALIEALEELFGGACKEVSHE